MFSTPLGIRTPNGIEVCDWIFGYLRQNDSWLAQVMCTGLMNILQARNNLVFNNAVPNPLQISHITMDSILEWCVISKSSASSSAEVTTGNIDNYSWFIQSDAGCFDGGIISLGCVIKDVNNRVPIANCQRISSFTDIATAEIMGILWAMHLALEHKIYNVVFQSDALMVVDYINGVSYTAALELLVNDCRLMLSSFKNATVVYLSRNFNVGAHHLVL